ncbi:MAG TPA: type II secretion system protein [Gaiellaceae bacterium]|nr:type II secretion system protein [Gaiellaceae bacterium]
MIERVRSRLRGEAGYSLVEMLTVMVIMSIVFAGITDIFVSGSKAQTEQDNRFQAELTTRLALDKVRRDIHCASSIQNYTTSFATMKISGCSGGDVSWCTAAVSGYSNRYRLYRQLGTSCADGTGTMYADYLTSGAVFPTNPTTAYTAGCGCLEALPVDLKVSNKGSAVIDAYELQDTIYLRNSARI